jgi:hypothetical protein
MIDDATGDTTLDLALPKWSPSIHLVPFVAWLIAHRVVESADIDTGYDGGPVLKQPDSDSRSERPQTHAA